MPSNLMGWPTLLIILVVIILLFGATKLPALAKSLGQSARAFKGEMRALKDESAAAADEITEDVRAASTLARVGDRHEKHRSTT